MNTTQGGYLLEEGQARGGLAAKTKRSIYFCWKRKHPGGTQKKKTHNKGEESKRQPPPATPQQMY
jgi:hypothetical protein